MNASAVGVAERIYDFAGLTLTDEMRETIAVWSEQNRAGSRGAHTYTAEQYGLTDDEIRDSVRALPPGVRPPLRVTRRISRRAHPGDAGSSRPADRAARPCER